VAIAGYTQLIASLAAATSVDVIGAGRALRSAAAGPVVDDADVADRVQGGE
jgi:hypothetical protein